MSALMVRSVSTSSEGFLAISALVGSLFSMCPNVILQTRSVCELFVALKCKRTLIGFGTPLVSSLCLYSQLSVALVVSTYSGSWCYYPKVKLCFGVCCCAHGLNFWVFVESIHYWSQWRLTHLSIHILVLRLLHLVSPTYYTYLIKWA
jgi:hypothetical protein